MILDEKSNIIIDDEETKRELRRSKMLERRSTLMLNGFDDVDKSDLTEESTSSDEEMETVMDKVRAFHITPETEKISILS